MVGQGYAWSSAARLGDVSFTANIVSVAGPYFSALGAVPVVGRMIGPDDDVPAADYAVVISERLWRATFASDPAVVGRSGYVAGKAVVVVGVVAAPLPPVGGLTTPDVWVPARLVPVQQLFGQLKAGVSIDQASSEVRAGYHVDTDGHSEQFLDLRRGMAPAGLPGGLQIAIGAVLVLGITVIAVAFASLTLMLVARVSAKEADITTRFTLGASVSDVLLPWTIEVAAVGVLATIVGLAFASWLAGASVHYFSTLTGLRIDLDTSADWRTAGYAALLTAIAIVAVVVFLRNHLARVSAMTSSHGSRNGTGGIWSTARSTVARGTLIQGQVASTVVLLLLAALLIRGGTTGNETARAVDPAHIVVARLDQSGADTAAVHLNNRRALDVSQQIPGVASAALATYLFDSPSVRAEADDVRFSHWVQLIGVTSDFFDVLRARIAAGRVLSAADDGSAAPMAVVDARTAAALWGGRNPIGASLSVEAIGGDRQRLQVVGVLADPGLARESRRPRLNVYVPYSYAVREWPSQAATLIARSAVRAEMFTSVVQGSLRERAPQVGVLSVRTLSSELAGDRTSARLTAAILGTLGIVGLLLSVAGLYGLTSFLASQRQREIGIRMSLGATRLGICVLAMGEGLPNLLKGMSAGGFVAVVLALLLKARSFPSIQAFDVTAWAAVLAAVLLVSMLSHVVPFIRYGRWPLWRLLRED